jgi:acyl carrier protein
MQQKQIEAVFIKILETTTGKRQELKATMLLQDDLGLDSLTRIDLAVALEEAFGVTISDEDLESFATVGDMLAFLDRAAQERSVDSIVTRD